MNMWATLWGIRIAAGNSIACPGLIAAPSVNRDIDDDDHRMICDCDVDDGCDDDDDNNDHIEYDDVGCGDARKG